MKLLRVALSYQEPNVKDALWLRPVGDGFALYVLDGGWKAVKIVDDNSTASLVDDTIQDLVGKNTDSASKDTIKGAKKYADKAADDVVGKDTDTKDDMTLYGLKAYIDDALQNL